MKLWHSNSGRFSISAKMIAIASLPFATSLAHANIIDGVSFEVGDGHAAMIYKLAAQKNMTSVWSFLVTNDFHPYWEFSAADVEERRYRDVPGQSRSIFAVGVTPVLRWQPNPEHGFGIEVAVGANYFSQIYNNAGARMGTRFQFGDHVGISYKFNKSIEIMAKFQHYSNAGIKEPNPAVNFGIMKLAYSF